MKINFVSTSCRFCFPSRRITIRSFITGIMSENETISFGKVLHVLEEDELPDLPPGGGINAKYVLSNHNY